MENQVIRKMAEEAFDMVLEGKLEDASLVFDAIYPVRPNATAVSLGRGLVSLLRDEQPSSTEVSEDLALSCFKGLKMMHDGQKHEAEMMLKKVASSDQIDEANLATAILTNEFSKSLNSRER